MNFKYLKTLLPTAALALSLGLTSCVDDLDVTPIDPSSNMEPDAQALFNKCYANMAVAGQGGANGDCDIDGLDGGTTGFVRQLFNANELTTDESVCCWGDEGIPAFNTNSYGASHPMLRGFYYRLFNGVSYCNHYLEVVGNYDEKMTAEVRFLRALYYYYLMDCYGNVPFTLALASENPDQIQRADLYKWLVEELNEIEPMLSDPEPKVCTFYTAGTNNGYGRADKAAAWLLLCRLYLNAEVYTGQAEWQLAADYAKKVMDSPYKIFTGGTATASAYRMLFMGDNGESGASVEAILPVLQDGAKTTSWGTTLFLMASCYKNDMESNGTTELWGGNRARPEFVKMFFPSADPAVESSCPKGTTAEMVAAAKDDRALLWGKDRTLDVTSLTEFSNGYSVTKFTNVYSNGGQPHNSQFPDTDFFLMRAAEAYLSFAEADARMHGGVTSEEGTAAVNKLRERAHAATRTSYTTRELLDEWSREFYYEGRRRTDLIRYNQFGGEAADYKWQWKGGVKEGVSFSANRNIFAIPDAEMNANSKLTQNPGY
ncbi:MAG: RagB/SusD family nutrient uptake outer membrane protein [Alloprevotella sp.]